jgi:hypothetical protein
MEPFTAGSGAGMRPASRVESNQADIGFERRVDGLASGLNDAWPGSILIGKTPNVARSGVFGARLSLALI